MHELVAQRVLQTCSKPEWTMLIFLDTSDLLWESYVTQFPSEQLEQGILVEDMVHELLGFVI